MLSSCVDKVVDDETINTQGENVPSLATQIANALNGLDVHINNDWFDDANQNAVLGGRG